MDEGEIWTNKIKDKCGIKERENYNIAKSESGAVKRCTQEKAIMDAFRYFALIWIIVVITTVFNKNVQLYAGHFLCKKVLGLS